ncbi:2-isopropylmalate synthase [Rhodothalassium salexigens]|uniref:2-isopropylmalate synthase n=1 Tax=Rhodothalassium salexigens TaxID=1086 RepID=UPI0019128FA8|nr:2-isopropylmalate synthase [Rhodothalassium salexigens]MBK5910589.1 2-isopropylmalate synthase [Rhodothalassium salexigens]
MTEHSQDQTPEPEVGGATAGDHVRIFDTTLRDGEQAPGFSMDNDQKRRVALSLAELGVDVIEAGFPAASRGDFRSVKTIAEEVRGPVICGLARCRDADIDAVAEATAKAERRRIHVFIGTSPIHRRDKLEMTEDAVVEAAVAGVRRARAACDDVEFSCEDAFRTEPDYLCRVVEAVIEAGATTINLPDTVGYAMPDDVRRIFAQVMGRVPNADRAVFSTHCHNDLGLAVANSLAAVEAGARQVECAVNGIGERAGNCATEEVIMALATRADHFAIQTRANTRKIYPTSRLLASVTGHTVQRNKAIVGENAFAHEAGIHQAGVIKNAETYEIMRPEDVGVPRNHIVLGKHSGRHAFAQRAEMLLGHAMTREELDRAFANFKALADRKKVITDSDVESLVMGHEMGAQTPWRIKTFQVSTNQGGEPAATATVCLVHTDGREVTRAATGNGPIEAAFNAIRSATGIPARLADFSVRSIGAGIDAQGWADVRLDWSALSVHGSGVATDVVFAGASAYLDAMNRLENKSAAQDSPERPSATPTGPDVSDPDTAPATPADAPSDPAAGTPSKAMTA